MNKNKCRMWDGRIKKYFYDPEIVFECLKQQMCGMYDHESEGVVFEWGIGVNDINGVKIHTGDILCITSRLYSNCGKTATNDFLETKYTVIWMDDGFGLKKHNTKDFKYKPAKGIWYLNELKETKIEIIGNIHDNPELLTITQNYWRTK